MLKIGQIVAYANVPGHTYKIIKKYPSQILTCDRYDIRNIKTGEILCSCRDKDLYDRKSKYFDFLTKYL